MASGTGIYLAAKLLNQIFNATAYVFATSIDLVLYTTGGVTSAAAGTLVTGTGYSALQVTAATSYFASTATNSITNTPTLSFGPAGGAWTVAVTLGIFEHGSTTNLLFYGDLAATKTLSSGDVFQFTGTNLTITQS
jgi:hypothetical protein